MTGSKTKSDSMQAIKVPKTMFIVSLFVLAALVVYIIVNVNKAERFVILLQKAQPEWLLLAVFLQMGTYICVGAIWNQVITSAKHFITLRKLARFSVEQLSINELIPAGGIAGNFVVFQGMRLLGLPESVAAEALLINILSNYIAYAIVSISALMMLWFHHSATSVVLYLIGVFFIILIFLLSVIIWLIEHNDRPLPKLLHRFKIFSRIRDVVSDVSRERVFSPKLLIVASLLNILIFLIDAATLWTVMHALGTPVGILTTFIAIVLASIAGTVSFLPGGVGGFEAGSVATLALLGIPIEAAITGTLLLRGFSLWLPLIPGLLMARRDVTIKI